MNRPQPDFIGVHLAVRDLAKSLDFYRRIGLPIPDGGETGSHVEIALDEGRHLAFSTVVLTKSYDPGWREPSGASPNVLQFALASRQAVDDLYAELLAAGYNGHLSPFDAFWGNRYAEVDDPDGNVVGFHSPTDPNKRAPGPDQ